MEVAEAGEVDDALVDPRVVLHRARAERVKAGVDAEGARRELREVTDELGLGDLGEPGRPLATKLLGELGDGRRPRRQARRPSALLRLLVDQLHAARASASR